MALHMEPEFEYFQLLKTPLMEGEQAFVERLRQYFATKPERAIELYVQPNINGARPDIVCIEKSTKCRKGGIWIIEVKDWDLKNYVVQQEGTKQTWYVRDKANHAQTVRSPLAQIDDYHHLFRRLVSPTEQLGFYRHQVIDASNELFYQIYEKKAANYLVKTAVYFHRHRMAPFAIDQSYTEVFFRHFSDQALDDFFQSSKYVALDDQSYQSVKQYLGVLESDFEKTPIVLDGKQAAILDDFKKGKVRKKFIGAAGVGKTELLAQMVAHTLEQKKEVLVLTFNITLKYFLRDRIRNALHQPIKKKKVSILHYHGLIQAEAMRYGVSVPSKTLEQADDINLFSQIEGIKKYDAVFLDECQDYKEEWIEMIQRYFLKADGIYVVCGDANQNIYGRTINDKKLPRVNILGRPNELTTNHRSENAVLQVANQYKQYFLSNKYEVPEVTDSQVENTISSADDERVILEETSERAQFFERLNQYFMEQATHPNDVALLSFTTEGLRTAIDQYNRVSLTNGLVYRQIKRYSRTVCTWEEVNHYVSLNQNQAQVKQAIHKHERLLKINFNPNYGTTKALTVNSLIGLEVKNAVLLLDDIEAALFTEDAFDELLYTALTRAQGRLFICYNQANVKNPRVRQSIEFLQSCLTKPAF